jgi:hypothetical protein
MNSTSRLARYRPIWYYLYLPHLFQGVSHVFQPRMFQRFVRRQPLRWIDAQQLWNQILHVGTQPQMFARFHRVLPQLNVALHHLKTCLKKQNYPKNSSKSSVHLQHRIDDNNYWSKQMKNNAHFLCSLHSPPSPLPFRPPPPY